MVGLLERLPGQVEDRLELDEVTRYEKHCERLVEYLTGRRGCRFSREWYTCLEASQAFYLDCPFHKEIV